MAKVGLATSTKVLPGRGDFNLTNQQIGVVQHFRAQMARPARIDMRYTMAVRLDGVVR
jgi:hypothetical protein